MQGLVDSSAGCSDLLSPGYLVILQVHIQVVSGFYTLQTILQLVFWKSHCSFVGVSGEYTKVAESQRARENVHLITCSVSMLMITT